jgi:hypothetical protein
MGNMIVSYKDRVSMLWVMVQERNECRRAVDVEAGRKLHNDKINDSDG